MSDGPRATRLGGTVEAFTPHIGRTVTLRDGGSDRQVWADTFTGLYHLPPESMPTPRTVLDVGANIGLTAAHYAYLWPQAKIVAVEMDRESAELCARNAPGVDVMQCAVWAQGGWGSYDPSGRPEAFQFRPRDVSGERVMGRTLRSIVLRMFGDEGVDFVKMDIECAEWGILSDPDWAPLVRHLLIELHSLVAPHEIAPVLVGKAAALLVGAGYAVEFSKLRHPQAVYARRLDV